MNVGETVETVSIQYWLLITGLKPGANEIAPRCGNACDFHSLSGLFRQRPQALKQDWVSLAQPISERSLTSFSDLKYLTLPVIVASEFVIKRAPLSTSVSPKTAPRLKVTKNRRE
jgi:hypothetical protein